MKVGFDLDGTLDRPGIAALALALLDAGHEVYVISGCFREAGEWQNHHAKYQKLARLGFPVHSNQNASWVENLHLHVMILDAASHEQFDRDYRLVDLGLRKGAYIAEQGIEVMFDDSKLYCDTMPSMCGAQIVHVR